MSGGHLTPFPLHITPSVISRTMNHQPSGTSTSGWRFKHPGRVGDSPLIGSGLYAESRVGAAVATGDGEEVWCYCCLLLLDGWSGYGGMHMA
jgi:hypothetical protein